MIHDLLLQMKYIHLPSFQKSILHEDQDSVLMCPKVVHVFKQAGLLNGSV